MLVNLQIPSFACPLHSIQSFTGFFKKNSHRQSRSTSSSQPLHPNFNVVGSGSVSAAFRNKPSRSVHVRRPISNIDLMAVFIEQPGIKHQGTSLCVANICRSITSASWLSSSHLRQTNCEPSLPWLSSKPISTESPLTSKAREMAKPAPISRKSPIGIFDWILQAQRAFSLARLASRAGPSAEENLGRKRNYKNRRYPSWIGNLATPFSSRGHVQLPPLSHGQESDSWPSSPALSNPQIHHDPDPHQRAHLYILTINS